MLKELPLAAIPVPLQFSIFPNNAWVGLQKLVALSAERNLGGGIWLQREYLKRDIIERAKWCSRIYAMNVCNKNEDEFEHVESYGLVDCLLFRFIAVHMVVMRLYFDIAKIMGRIRVTIKTSKRSINWIFVRFCQ